MDWVPPPASDRERRTPLRRRSRRAEIREELAHHTELLVERLVDEGWSREEARREARSRLDVDAWTRRLEAAAPPREEGTTMRTRFDALVQGLRGGMREITRRPGYALAVTLALGVGIGGSGLVLSLADSIFLRPVPVPELDRVVRVWESVNEDNATFRMAYPTVLDYREEVDGMADLAGFMALEVAVERGGRAFEVDATAVTWNYFRALDLTPALGRFFVSEEEPRIEPVAEGETAFGSAGSPAVAVLGWDLWNRRYGGDPEIVGRTVRLGQHPVTVVGVAPRGFRGLSLNRDVQVWIPIPLLPDVTIGLYASRDALTTRHLGMLDAVARLRHEVDPSTLRSRLGSTRQRLVAALGVSDTGMPEIPEGVPLHTTRPAAAVALGDDQERLRGFVGVVTVLSLFVLAVGTLNAMQLRVVRMRARGGEIGVRRALGATRARIVGHVAADAVYVGCGGVVVGVLLANGVLASLSRFTLPGGVALERLPLGLDAGLFALLGGVALLAVTAAAVIPAVLGAGSDPSVQLRGRRTGLGRGLLVAGQVSICTVLVASAGLFLQSFVTGLDSPVGYDPEGRVALTFSPAAHGQVEVAAVAERVRQAALGTPGVESAVVTSHLPPEPWDRRFSLVPLGGSLEESSVRIHRNVTLGGAASQLGIPVVEGRDLAADGAQDGKVAVLNRAGAAALFPERDPVGRWFKVFPFEPDSVRIVGVVENATMSGVQDEDSPWVWLDARRYSGVDFAGRAHLVVKGSGSEAELLRTLQPRLARAVPEVLFLDPRSVEEEVVRALMPQHLGLLLFAVFGGIAVLLAATGVGGVIAFELASRRRELAIRAALGARWRELVRSVAGTTWISAGAGVGGGLLLVAVVSRVIGAFLLDTHPFDPLAIVGTVGVLTLSVLAASALALVRARTVQPAGVLAEEGRGAR